MAAYASLAELDLHANLPAAVLQSLPTERREAALEAASRTLDSYIASGRYQPPFTNAGPELKRRTCHIAAYDLICAKGFDPERQSHQLVIKNYDDALAWGRDCAAGRARPTLEIDATPDVIESSPSCESEEPRGWNE